MKAFENKEQEKLKELIGEDVDLKEIIEQNKIDREEVHSTEKLDSGDLIRVDELFD